MTWQLVYRAHVAPAYKLPSPSDSLSALRDEWKSGDLTAAIWNSVRRGGSGFRASPVSPAPRGRRLVCVCWLVRRVRAAAQRRLLYEMDMAITALRQQAFGSAPEGAGESPEGVRLPGCYANLLRMGADGWARRRQWSQGACPVGGVWVRVRATKNRLWPA